MNIKKNNTHIKIIHTNINIKNYLNINNDIKK